MVSIPPALMLKFDEQLQIRAIPGTLHGAYQKWLRYYLDFCQKYHFPPKQEKSLPSFMQKLQEKRQSKVHQEQAAAAITIYYDILREMGKIGMDNVKEFLTSLAVKSKVSSTTQNQAFNSLLFFYRHVLGKEFGKIDGVVRAKRRPHIPVVLSREEIDAVLRRLPPPMILL